MTKRDMSDKRNFVIIGGGAAGLNCAETLRYSGYTGKITLVSNEKLLPYDRTLLTKTLPFGDAKKFQLRESEWLKDADIDIVEDSIYSIHTSTNQVTFARGQPMKYDKICIATGSTPKKTEIKGSDAKHVYSLRTAKDQEQIKTRAAEVKRGIAIIGCNFIGSESAASLKMKYKDQFDIHLIGETQVPLQKVLGKEVGETLLIEHLKNGIKLHMSSEVKEINKDSDGNVCGVTLANGTQIAADMVVIGTGCSPQTKFLARTECGIKTDDEGAVVCDPFLQTSQKDIFAAGDVCSFPYW